MIIKKLIKRKNLLLVNALLALIFIWAAFSAFIMPVIDATGTPAGNASGSAPFSESSIQPLRSVRAAYNIILTNNLFTFKGPVKIIISDSRDYDLTKTWELIGIIKYPDGLHALIRDRGKADPKTKQPITYDVKAGDFLENHEKPRTYIVEIKEITKEYVKYYRHDMQNVLEENRTFAVYVWQR